MKTEAQKIVPLLASCILLGCGCAMVGMHRHNQFVEKRMALLQGCVTSASDDQSPVVGSDEEGALTFRGMIKP